MVLDGAEEGLNLPAELIYIEWDDNAYRGLSDDVSDVRMVHRIEK